MNIKRFMSIQLVFTVLTVFGIGAKAMDTHHKYEEKQKVHQEVVQEKKELAAEAKALQEEKQSLEATLQQREQAIQQKEQELQQTKQQLTSANEKLVNTGIVAPDEAGVAKASKTLNVKATSYSADPAENGGTYNGKVLTRTGFNLTDNPNAKVIAVDPSVIPLGSTVWVEGYGYAKALDTGGAIKGNRIDVFIADKGKGMDWGVRNIQVKVIEEA